MFRVSIHGPKAVGKTTLVRELSKVYTSAFIFSRVLNPVNTINGLSFYDYKSVPFYKLIYNVKKLISDQNEILYNVNNSLIIFDRGPEDLEFFITHFNLVTGKKWPVIESLHSELQILKTLHSDIIIYLYASPELLRQRMISDVCRDRNNFDDYIKNVYDIELGWYKSLSNCWILDSTNLKEEELVCLVKNRINNTEIIKQ